MTITFLAPDGVQVTAQQYRQANAALYGGGSGRPLGGRSGFRVGTPSSVLTATSTTWTLAPCSVQIDPGATTNQGMYGWSSDSNITGSVTASDATYDRKDIVYIQVNDSSAGDGSGATTAPVLYLAGAPSATPAPPSLPPRSFLVGTITVPKTGGGSPTVVLNPARFVSAGAPLPASLAERDSLTKYDTFSVQRTDLPGRPVQTWDGANWNSPPKADIGQGDSVPAIKSSTAPVTVTTNAAGYSTVSYPTAFPSATSSFMVMEADDTMGSITLKSISATASAFNFRAFASTGATINNTPIKVTWIATGY